jgi:hypothetical protein
MRFGDLRWCHLLGNDIPIFHRVFAALAAAKLNHMYAMT